MKTELTGRNVAILGAGRSGLGAARLARKLGAHPVVFDDGDPVKLKAAVQALENDGFTSVIGLENVGKLIKSKQFALAVTSPGLDASYPLPKSFTDVGIPLIGEIEFAFQHTNTPLIAITGTNGKTTTTELVSHLLNECGHKTIPCGNYGHALSEVVAGVETYDVLTVEIARSSLKRSPPFIHRSACG